MRYVELTTVPRNTTAPNGQLFNVPGHVVYIEPSKIISLEPAWGPSRALQGELTTIGTMVNCGNGIAYVVQEPLAEVLESIENASVFSAVTNH